MISGPSSSCTGVNLTYSIAAVPGAASYNWIVPPGWTINGSTTGTSISVNLQASAQSGNVSVATVNPCGTSSVRTLAVTVNPVLPIPGPISGNTSVCASSTQSYSIAAISGATSYTWTVPTGWSFKSNSPTSISVTAKAGTTGGNIGVTANNACGNSPLRTLAVTVVTVPATPGTISGNSSPCAGSVGTYSITAIGGASSYSWLVPKGWTINSGQGTISIQVTAGKTGQKGNITITASNACGTSAARTLSVTPATCTSIASGGAITSVQSSIVERVVKVSPNPASTILRIELSGYAGDVTMQLMNLQGKVFKQERIKTSKPRYAQQQMNVEDIASGTYLLVVINKNGNRQTEKVVIAH